jgi:predicted transcriptional regulator of viral defense system
MNFRDLYRTLEKNRYYLFSNEDLLAFFPRENKANVKEIVYRWKGKGWICALKRGLYELSYPKDFVIPDMYIANRLYEPSYVSLETALSYYSIIPEVSMAVTSVSTKPTRAFKNRHGLFIYRTVRPCLFMGYYVESQKGFDFLIAEPEKALADYIYFKTFRKKRGADLSGERLDRDAISRLNKKKIARYGKSYGIEKGLHAYL